MRANAGILLIIGLLFIFGSLAAADPFIITTSSSMNYLIAGSDTYNKATISVYVINSTTKANVVNGRVSFTVNDAELGTFQNPGPLYTDSNGNTATTFVSKTKSGFANIGITVTYDNATSTTSFIQKIDHNKPSKVFFIPPYEGTVGTVVAFNTSFTDYWENPIDNAINPSDVHAVTLHVHGPSPDDCYFVKSGVNLGHDLTNTPLDANGNVPVQIRLTTTTGSNYVSMDAFDLSPPPKVITAVPGIPASIIQTWNPSGNPPELPAGASFAFVYTLYDKFGNPSGGQDVWINTTSGKNVLAKSQDNGNIGGTYEETITGTYTVTATAVNNNSVTISQDVLFYNAAATTHNVVANPQTMPSRDVKPEIYSSISAKVMDAGGNGVPNETVTFTLSGVTYNPTTVGSTSQPSFSSSGTVTTVSNITGADGVATVQFYPGAFVTSGPTYSQNATGNCIITATWNGIPKVINVAWKNYAYLSAVLTVTPDQAKVGDTVDVHLKLNGDGWNLAKKPIDVVLIIDRSGSMGDGSPTRISSAKSAASTFVDAMSTSTNNRVGLVSFASSTTPDQSLTNSYSTVKTKINNLNAYGATQMRRALYEAITDLDNNGRSDAVKAVILLTDGDWNYDGTPLAVGNGFPSSTYGLDWPGNVANFDSYEYYSDLGGGTSHTHNVPVPDGSHWVGGDTYVADYTTRSALHYDAQLTSQNMSVYANENGVRVYALSFVDTPSTAVQQALTILTTSTENGFYQHAPDAAALNNLYAQIATQLQEDAGVDTTADMDFGQLIVDDKLIDTSTPGNAMFDYVADPTTAGVNPGDSYTQAPGSTMVNKYNATHNLIPGPEFTVAGPLIVNQIPDWTADKSLHFNIGVVKLGETWETNFRLKVLKEGTILLFSPGSVVNFKDDEGVESSLTLENLSYVTAVSNPTDLNVPKITIIDKKCGDPAVIPISWTTKYTGSEADMTEELQVQYMGPSGSAVMPGGWKTISTIHRHVTGDDTTTNNGEFDMRKVAPGEYRIAIHAYTPATTVTEDCGKTYLYSTEGKTFINLE